MKEVSGPQSTKLGESLLFHLPSWDGGLQAIKAAKPVRKQQYTFLVL